MNELSEPVLQLRGVSRRFAGVQALEDVDLDLAAGEVHALVGENGAGKSTLVKILAGVHRPDAGTIRLGGEEVDLDGPAAARDRGIAVIHQQPNLFPDLDVAENVFVGRLPRGRLGRIDWREARAATERLLARLGVVLRVTTPVRGLPVADQQLVEIVKALSIDARVLVMDEPTAALSGREVERLFASVRQLRLDGVAVLFVNHRLEEVFALCDRITVLRDGRRVITAPIADLTPAETIRHMVGRRVDSLYPKEPVDAGEVALQVRGLTRSGVFRDIGFDVRRGEIVALAGLVGAGRTEVARALFGIDRADSGDVLVRGRRVEIASPAGAMRAGLAYVPEDRHHQGLVLGFSIAANISLPVLSRLTRAGGVIDAGRERSLARDYAERLQVRATGVEQPVADLSGGNQQKVVIAKWLATRPDVLILDEPTRGIDVGAKAEVHRIISRLAADGLAILLISSELPEVIGMADRVVVFHEGRVAATLPRADATEERIMAAATGHEAVAR
jgi:rhamnose transport system ATP-binding protein